MSKERNEPAFPVTINNDGTTFSGMTLRDYFAAKTMQALLSSNDIPYWADEHELARKSYSIADSMLLERENEAQ